MSFRDMRVDDWSSGGLIDAQYGIYSKTPSEEWPMWADTMYLAWVEAIRCKNEPGEAGSVWEARVEYCERHLTDLFPSLIIHAKRPDISALTAAHIATVLVGWRPLHAAFSKQELLEIRTSAGMALVVGLQKSTFMSEPLVLLDLVAASLYPRETANRALREAGQNVNLIQAKKWRHWACMRISYLHDLHKHLLRSTYWAFQAKYIYV